MIIFAIGKGKKTVPEIIQETGLSQTLVSFHLRPLRESGILSRERMGLLSSFI
jgi:DNA-binding transcriptional ArsR family regulator